ncbi:MAG TPA: monovalent cation/H(+) antiporter subunit G [Clostridia bacterium]|nr:monovalent cation/H(+) antiporter subunit G [Clostridia bacterium]
MKILAVIFLALGFFLTAVAAIGILRFPDFYTRMHASGKADTLGVALTLVGLALYEGFSLTSFKILFISAFIMFANPIGTHILVRAAHQSGLKPLTKRRESK